MRKKIKKHTRSKRFKWLKRFKDDERLHKYAFLSLLQDKLTIKEYEDLIDGRMIGKTFLGAIVWMILQLGKKVAWIEEELRKMKYAEHLRKSAYLRLVRDFEEAIRESA